MYIYYGTMAQIIITVTIFTLILFVNISMEDEVNSATTLLYKIEGKVQVTETPVADWASSAKVIVDGGRFIGFIKQDGSFVISNVPPGSYLVEVSSPSYIFEPARVDISSKTGKMRARKSDLLRPTAVTALPYPLKFKASGQAKFFAKREEWNLLSTLMNPMVLMMLAPVLLMLVIPRMMKNLDPESQKEMEDQMSMLQGGSNNLPSMEEWLTNLLGGGSSKAQPKKLKKENTKKSRR